MGSLDSAEASDLVGLFLLYNLSAFDCLDSDSVGLYRDDGLLVVKNSSKIKVDRIRKMIYRVFKDLGLRTIVTTNVRQVDFLDVTLDLANNIFQPYVKVNSNPLYVHPNSNHPPSVIKHIPTSIEFRISANSYNKEVFNKHSDFYNSALKNSGYKNTTIQYKNPVNCNHNKKRRSRKVIWFTPPFNVMVKTKLGRIFINLIKKHFPNPETNPLSKIFNPNTLKLSYSCADNLEQIIKKHNNIVFNKYRNSKGLTNQQVTNCNTNYKNTNNNLCNCRNPNNCPLQNNCGITSVVYLGTISTIENPNIKKFYIGSTMKTFKERWRGHMQSFNHSEYRYMTSLSKYFWNLKDKNKTPTIKWSLVTKARTCNSLYTPCYLCLNEKFEIIRFKNKADLLNQRYELTVNCKHRYKFNLV